MKKQKLLLIPTLFLLAAAPAFSQDTTVASTSKTLIIKKSVDIPLTAAAAAWTMYGFAQISNKDGSSQAEVDALKKAISPGSIAGRSALIAEVLDKSQQFTVLCSSPPILLYSWRWIKK